MNRKSGILLPVFSLPSPYGIGTMGQAAYQWIDFLRDSGQSIWQILPIGPTSYGDSPYQSYSSFAGNPYLIDLDMLCDEGLLTKDECNSIFWNRCNETIAYDLLYQQRIPLLRKAFKRFAGNYSLSEFMAKHTWLTEYALFMAIKDSQHGNSWQEWPSALRVRAPQALAQAVSELKSDIDFYIFLQYIFWNQWHKLKQYANKNGILIIGDVPIYAALDSADVWSNQSLFHLNDRGHPTKVAGCPPDAFSSTGQLWGNPLYRWDIMKQSNYNWWMQRLQAAFSMFDVVRIDHFRGFESYYAIPASETTAINGWWEPGPGMDFIAQIRQHFHNPSIIAEDLGFLTSEVRALLYASGFPGMKVLQFAFDRRERSNYLPHTYTCNSVVYTGTHDNQTTVEWFVSAPEADIEFAKQYLCFQGQTKEDFCRNFVCAALASVCDTAIIPLQDWLGLDGRARINEPATIGKNWKWRMSASDCTKQLAHDIHRLTELYARC